MTKALWFQGGGDLIFFCEWRDGKKKVYPAYSGSSVIFFASHESIPIIVHVLE